jgi:hypothetical protein
MAAVDGILDRLRGVALGAARGDPVATKAAAQLTADKRKAEDEAEVLRLAIEAVETEERAEQARVAAAKEAARLAEVERISAEVVAAAAVADDAARALVGALRRRRAAVRSLHSLGLTSELIFALDGSGPVARSLRASGLADFLALPDATGMPAESIHPLADFDKNYLGGTP